MKPQITQFRCWLVLFSLTASLQITLGYYDPAAQRWINRDPIGEKGGRNLAAFVGNVPSGRLDRWGLQAAPPVIQPPILQPPILQPPVIQPPPTQPPSGGGGGGGGVFGCIARVVFVSTCLACAGGVATVDAYCLKWSEWGYPTMQDCTCDFYLSNYWMQAACKSCFGIGNAMEAGCRSMNGGAGPVYPGM